MTQLEDNEPPLLLTEHERKDNGIVLVSEENVVPKLRQSTEPKNSNVWYLDKGASNHMTLSALKVLEVR